ncbi:N-acetylglucosamine-6-phosphate deacetylase [Motilibacter peucedani]|uniref:N-acetylglucosamine-6-phosphate deacetylase n=1 Tax=Motilibacter peucedani TaxID=598650 RepID=A0A420XLY1_9ACTN|nr:N-acetylglucosamine-6-phosphate deacetylase [Motilibacter peucedani]RKS69367.1 N-acetylglucosamine-6-phosphate deacetylase [Motilibacter peucedani]
MTRLGAGSAFVDGSLLPGDVEVEDGRVAAVGLSPAGSGIAAPGLVDLQLNGYAGTDLLTAGPEQWAEVGRALARDGVTAYVANLITSPEPVTTAALRTAAAVADDPGGARLLGAHLEGPFLSPERAGTHPPADLREPDVALLDRLRAAGPVVGITVAPELPGGLELVRALVERGVLVALGHTQTDAETAHAAFDAGARTVTHVFNAMSAPTSRAAGLAGVALTRGDVAVQLICDGVHLSDDVSRLVVRAAADRIVLVTDALSATGAPDGDYALGSVTVHYRGGRARNSAGGLAGSVLTMHEALRNVVDAGARLEDALAAATLRPAALLRRDDLGRLRPGDPADLVVLDDSLALVRTYRAGVPTT